MSIREDFIRRTRNTLRSPRNLEDPHYDEAIDKALARHNRFRPRIVMQEFTGDGSTYDFTLTSFTLDFSNVLSVEYPAGRQRPTYVLEKDYFIYRKPDGTAVLRLAKNTPSTSEKVLVAYTAPHTTTSNSSTIPGPDESAFVNLCCYFACLTLSAYYKQQDNSTMDSDAIEWRSKGSLWEDLGKKYYREWANHLGMDEKDLAPAASRDADLDLSFTWGTDPIVHNRGNR